MKDLSMHILDIAQNSTSANADLIEIQIIEKKIDNLLQIVIKDNGKGMSEELASKVLDPFVTTRTTRKVGLGLPLFKQNAERTGGQFNLKSEIGKGTVVEARFVLNNIDCLPLGDIGGVVVLLATCNPGIDFIYQHVTDSGEYVFDTLEVKSVLEDTPINDIKIVTYLKELIYENLMEIRR